MRKLFVALVASLGLLVGSSAGAVTLDFEQFVHGEDITGSTISGVTITADNPRMPFDLAVIFDTTVTGSSDMDLQAGSPAWAGGNLSEDFLGFDPQLGNVLMVQENNDDCASGICSDPDDEMLGGSIFFDFDMPVSSFGFDLVDIDRFEQDGFVKLYSGNDSVMIEFGDLLDSDLFGNRTANRVAPLIATELGIGLIDKAEIHFDKSGAVDNVVFEPVPEPATLPLIAAGLGALAVRRRRRNAN